MRRTKVGAEIVGFDVIERAWPSEESGDKDYHLRTAVSTLAERNAFGRTPVVVSIPEPAFSRFIPLPLVDRRRIPDVVRYEARQQIPFPIEEVVWDYQPVREPTEVGEETEVAIFSLRSQFLYALLANLSLCGVQPAAILPVPLALYNHLTFDRDIARGTIVVDLGASSTDILICDPENFRVRNIPVSGNGITRGLAERLKISRAEAEALKRESTDEVQASRLFKLIQPTLNDLVGQVQRTIGFFKSQIHNVRIEQALLLGRTFRLPGVSEFLVDQLGCDLIPANTLERITLAAAVDGESMKQKLPLLAVATGLALQGIGLGRVQVNLMPREFLFRREVAKKRPYAAAIVGCLAVMLATNLLSLKSQEARVRKELRTQEETRSLVGRLREVENKYGAAKGAASNAVRRLDEPVALSTGYPDQSMGYRGCIEATNALNRILHAMSKEIKIEGIAVSPEEVELTADEYGGKSGGRKRTLPAMKLVITGRTRRDPTFVDKNLVKQIERASTTTNGGSRPQFANVEFKATRLQAAEESAGVNFTIRCDFLAAD